MLWPAALSQRWLRGYTDRRFIFRLRYPLKVLNTVVAAIDRFTDITGRAISWLTIVMVAITVCVVVLRYWFDSGSIALQESITYLHAIVFMMGIAFTLQRGGHVRVDIFYAGFSVRRKAKQPWSHPGSVPCSFPAWRWGSDACRPTHGTGSIGSLLRCSPAA